MIKAQHFRGSSSWPCTHRLLSLQGGLCGDPEAAQRGRGGSHRGGRVQEEEHPGPAGVPGEHPEGGRLRAHVTDALLSHSVQWVTLGYS